MCLKTIIFCAVFSFTAYGSNLTGVSHRQGKFWPFYVGFIRFENTLCNTNEGFQGTCYTRDQCDNIDGYNSGICAKGAGRCCLVQRSCGALSDYNNTYFTNTGYPNANSGSTECVFTVRKCSDDICQLRLDFLSLSLAQPNGNGSCVTDSLTVIGGTGRVPMICGENSGQHLYVNFNQDGDINIVLSVTSAGRMWNIKASQIGCDCPTLAPTGCLMYYTSVSGTVNSFNYGIGMNPALVTELVPGNMDPFPVPGTREMANLNYGVCIQPQPGYCSIQWSQGSDLNSFTVSGYTALAEVDPTQRLALGGSNCTTDYVVIPNPNSLNYDRFCGNAFTTVVSNARPFVLTVVTDGTEVNGDIANRGFSLNFQQLPCRTGVGITGLLV